jgi:predicted AlkP superfamily pyrophosphatase or phosphodiesterase
VSFDGFRWDYPELHGAPALLELAREGARAELVPSFPSKTYPNHYTLVTGLRPEHHGIVANSMRDPVWNADFSLADRSSVESGRWWEGVPIWVTAERHGLPTAASFWPGTEAEIQGVRPRIWKRYDSGSDDAARVDEMLSWLDRTPRKRPRLLLAYFSRVDSAGHSHGPAAPQTRAAVHHVDAMLARLRAGVAARGLAASTDWIVVSDHGMTDLVPGQTIAIESFVDLADVDVLDANVVGLLQPKPGREDAVLAALAGAHPHLHAARKSEMPERLHYRAHRRIPPLVVWVDPGWKLVRTRAEAAAPGGRAGSHGYDPEVRDMHGIFVASGPAFRQGLDLPPFENVDTYELLCRLLQLPPAPNDGDPESTRAALRPEPSPETAAEAQP